MNSVAVIPARAGSKRIPRKNIRLFCGKPIISYSIETALESTLFDQVLVSTDDEEIATVSREYGATVDELRPPEFSDDVTGVLDVVSHEIRQLANRNYYPSDICLIYATAPMLRTVDLKQSYEVFKTSDVDFVFSAAEFGSPIFRAFTILDDGRAKLFQPQHYHVNSQDLPCAFHDATHFCWGRPEAMMNLEAVEFSKCSKPFVIQTIFVADIVTPDNWTLAEWLFKAHRSISTNK